ncbi:MAG: flagellar assembly protein FliH [Methylophaga sp.]|nr:flagellar assembly protein FliH [Methylophaga sp.]
MTSSKDELVTEQSDVISSDEIAAAYQRWEAPTMVSVTDVEAGLGPLSVKDIEKLQKEAEEEGYKAGFEKGREAGEKSGLEAGQQEIKQQVAYLQQVMASLNAPLAEVDQHVEEDLIALVTTMTRQLVRRELKMQPEHVIGAVRAAMAVLPINDRKLKIFLHPQDVELVKTGLSIEDEDSNWKWVEDPLLTRGGVRLITADTTIDATVEARLNSVINKLLGEERVDDVTE